MQSLERTGLNTQSRVHINKVEQLLNSVLAEVQEQANRLAALEGRVGPANDTTVSAQLQKLGDELRQQQQRPQCCHRGESARSHSRLPNLSPA